MSVVARRGLAEDYNKWATQEEYRIQRAKAAAEAAPFPQADAALSKKTY